MFCPKCKHEYRQGLKVCENCGIKLVADLKQEEIKNMDEKIKSYIWLYWTIWLFIIAIMFYIKFFYLENPGDFPVELFMLYVLAVWIPLLLLNIYEANRLSNYLESNYSHKTNKFKNRYGRYKIISLLTFISKNNCDDNLLYQYGVNYKKFLVFTLFGFLTLPVLFFVLM